MPTVQLPNGTELEFPDGMSQDAMRDAIYKNFPEFAPKSAGTSAATSDDDRNDGAVTDAMGNVSGTISDSASIPSQRDSKSVMDGVSQSNSAALDAGMGPMRSDFYTATKAAVESLPLDRQQAIAAQNGQAAKIARSVLSQSESRAEHLAQGDSLSATPDDVARNAGENLRMPQQTDAYTQDETFRQKTENYVRSLLGMAASNEGRDEKAAAQAFILSTAKRDGITVDDMRHAVGGMRPELQQFAEAMLDSGTLGLRKDQSMPAEGGMQEVAKGAGSLAGFILGPAKVAGAALSPFRLAELIKKGGAGVEIAKAVIDEAATIGLASGLESTGKALDQTKASDAIGTVAEAAKGGAEVGGIFGAAKGLIPTNTAAGWAGRFAGINAATDLSQGTNPLDDRPLEKKVFDYGLNAYFAKHGSPIDPNAVAANDARDVALQKSRDMFAPLTEARTIDRAAQQQAMADLGKAKSVDEAVAAAERAVSTPNTDTSVSAMMKAIRPLRGDEPAPRMDTAIPGERIEPTFGEQAAPVETPTGLLHDQQEPSHDRNAAADAVPLRDGRTESIEAGAVGMGVAEAGRESVVQPADRGQGNTGKAVPSGAKDIPVADQATDRQPALDQPKAVILKDKTPITLTTEKVGDFHIITAHDAAGREVGNLTYATTEKNGQRVNPTVEVDPSMQRKGLATAMYDHAEANGGLIPDRDAAGAVRTDDGAAFRDARAGKVAEPEAPKPLSAAEQKRADKIDSLSEMKDKELRALTQNQKTPQYLKLEAANVLNERKSARSEKASAAAKRSAKSMGIDPERETMAVAIAKLGGIDREAAEGRMKLTPEELSIRGHGIKRVFVKGGMSLDEAAEKLSELGYINRDEHSKADLRDFEDKLGEVAGGNEVHTPQGLMRKAAEEHAKAMEEIGAKNESEYAEVEQHVDEAPDKLQSFIDAAFDSPITNRTLSDEELDHIFGPARTSESVSQDRAAAPADESHQRDQAPPPAKADARHEVDTGEDIPVRYFKSVKVDHLVHIEDEGTTETIKVSAKDALASVREDIDSYKQLLDCLKG